MIKVKKRITTHPGEVLSEEFLKPLKISSTNSRWKSEFRRPVSVRSCTDAEPSHRKLLFV